MRKLIIAIVLMFSGCCGTEKTVTVPATSDWKWEKVIVHEPLAYHVAFESMDGTIHVYMACFQTPVRSLEDGEVIWISYRVVDKFAEDHCLLIGSYREVKQAAVGKAR